MQTETLFELIEQSIRLELNAAAIYHVFFEAHPEDAEFWWRLYLEEKNHAALIRSAKESFAKIDKFPLELISGSLEVLKMDNARLEALLEKFKQAPPNRREAFQVAIELENTAGELHYLQFMEKKAQNSIESVFQHLNQEDKNHAARIQAYYDSHFPSGSLCANC
jgi:rubrerythrin